MPDLAAQAPLVAAVLADGVSSNANFASLLNPADGANEAALFAILVRAVLEGQTGTGLYTPQRLGNVITNVPATAVTAGTPATLLTSAAGKRWRILAYSLSLSVAGGILFKEAGALVLSTPLMAAGVGLPSGPMGNGLLATNPADTLQIDVTATGSVSGWVLTMQE